MVSTIIAVVQLRR